MPQPRHDLELHLETRSGEHLIHRLDARSSRVVFTHYENAAHVSLSSVPEQRLERFYATATCHRNEALS